MSIEDKIKKLADGFSHVAGVCDTGLTFWLENPCRRTAIKFTYPKTFFEEIRKAPDNYIIKISFPQRSLYPLGMLKGLQTACVIKELMKIPTCEIGGNDVEPAVRFSLKALKEANVEQATFKLSKLRRVELPLLRERYQEPEIFAELTHHLGRSR